METAQLPPFELNPQSPLQQQIHNQFVQWIGQGRLATGVRLPATRLLSEQLGVSRNTVVAVIEQLKAEGFVESQIGRGSFIAHDLPTLSVESTPSASYSEPALPSLSSFAEEISPLMARHHDKALPFTPGVPDVDQFPHPIWQKTWRLHQDRSLLLGYCDDQGYLPLRESIADYLRVSRGVHCSASQILITQGAQQAISLCAQMLLNEGDSVLHENPGYRGASSAFKVRNPNLMHVPLLDQVIDVDWILNHPEASSAKLVYTCPTHQYPMGGLLSASKRMALIQWAQENQVWIIEDDYDSEYHFLHKPIAAMQGMTENNTVIYMGSFSKVLFPSLRLGYLVLPKPLVKTFTTAKSFITGESPLIPQAVVADFIQEGHFVRHIRRMRQNYKEKWQDFSEKIQLHLGERVQIIAESVGMHIVLEIPGIDDIALRDALRKEGFGSSPLSVYYLGKAEKTGLVLGFGNTTAKQRTELVLALSRQLD